MEGSVVEGFATMNECKTAVRNKPGIQISSLGSLWNKQTGASLTF